MIIELLLSSHCRDCTTCAKNGVCTLQKLASQLGISEIRFENHKKPLPLDTSSDCVIRDPNKCILCGDCVRTCDESRDLAFWILLSGVQKCRLCRHLTESWQRLTA